MGKIEVQKKKKFKFPYLNSETPIFKGNFLVLLRKKIKNYSKSKIKMQTESAKEHLFLKATLIASSISGFLGKLISHPLDTVKAKAQVLYKIQ